MTTKGGMCLYTNMLLQMLSILILILGGQIATASTEIAITVDDLPVHGDIAPGFDRLKVAKLMLNALEKHGLIGVYGMINGKRVEESPETLNVLKLWVSKGQLLANHTYSHPDLVTSSVASYIDDIGKNDKLLGSLMGSKDFRFFRYPFLAEGETSEKRIGVRAYLRQQKYRIAEVTVDWFDYEWNPAYIRCLAKKDDASIRWLKSSYIENAVNAVEVARLLSDLDFQRQIKNIMLLHIGLFESQMMDDLLSAYESKGVQFITLADAVSDPVFQTDPKVLRPRPYTFLNQVRVSKNLKNPPRVAQIYNSLPEDKLSTICK